MPSKTSPLMQKLISQQIRNTTNGLRDQSGFVENISGGLYSVRLVDGGRVRGIPDINSLTNSNLSIGSPVYVVVREGIPLIDGVQIQDIRLSEAQSIQQLSGPD